MMNEVQQQTCISPFFASEKPAADPPPLSLRKKISIEPRPLKDLIKNYKNNASSSEQQQQQQQLVEKTNNDWEQDTTPNPISFQPQPQPKPIRNLVQSYTKASSLTLPGSCFQMMDHDVVEEEQQGPTTTVTTYHQNESLIEQNKVLNKKLDALEKRLYSAERNYHEEHKIAQIQHEELQRMKRERIQVFREQKLQQKAQEEEEANNKGEHESFHQMDNDDDDREQYLSATKKELSEENKILHKKLDALEKRLYDAEQNYHEKHKTAQIQQAELLRLKRERDQLFRERQEQIQEEESTSSISNSCTGNDGCSAPEGGLQGSWSSLSVTATAAEGASIKYLMEQHVLPLFKVVFADMDSNAPSSINKEQGKKLFETSVDNLSEALYDVLYDCYASSHDVNEQEESIVYKTCWIPATLGKLRSIGRQHIQILQHHGDKVAMNHRDGSNDRSSFDETIKKQQLQIQDLQSKLDEIDDSAIRRDDNMDRANALMVNRTIQTLKRNERKLQEEKDGIIQKLEEEKEHLKEDLLKMSKRWEKCYNKTIQSLKKDERKLRREKDSIILKLEEENEHLKVTLLQSEQWKNMDNNDNIAASRNGLAGTKLVDKDVHVDGHFIDSDILEDDDDSCLSAGENEELDNLVTLFTEGKEVDKLRISELLFFQRWKNGEDLYDTELDVLNAFRKRRRIQRRSHRRVNSQHKYEVNKQDDIEVAVSRKEESSAAEESNTKLNGRRLQQQQANSPESKLEEGEPHNLVSSYSIAPSSPARSLKKQKKNMSKLSSPVQTPKKKKTSKKQQQQRSPSKPKSLSSIGTTTTTKKQPPKSKNGLPKKTKSFSDLTTADTGDATSSSSLTSSSSSSSSSTTTTELRAGDFEEWTIGQLLVLIKALGLEEPPLKQQQQQQQGSATSTTTIRRKQLMQKILKTNTKNVTLLQGPLKILSNYFGSSSTLSDHRKFARRHKISGVGCIDKSDKDVVFEHIVSMWLKDYHH